ncbi:MAG TPA: hypothetical protein VF168_14245 [Trueperaceae bacterium]
MKRICVIGTTGAGKTTFAGRLADLLGCEQIELDAHHWGPHWTPRPTEEFRASVRAVAAQECWVADGNYHKVRDLLWARADTLVWLDYSIGTILTRLLLRTMRRVARREELWGGNRENLWWHLATRRSLFLWALQTHWRRRRAYPQLIAAPEFSHLRVVRLYSPAQAEVWLTQTAAAEATSAEPTR